MRVRFALLIAAAPGSLAAQVGFHPGESPYRDITAASRAGPFAGWFSGAHDPAGVLPHSAPIFGLRYEVGVGGPADVTFRVARVATDRNVVDPTKPVGERVVEDRDIKLGIADVGIAFNLTGQRSWHSLVPSVNANVGIISDFQGRDVGGYRHGTTFVLGYGLGVRVVPPQSKLTVRVDLGSYFYSTQYPNSYFTGAVEGTSVAPTSASGAKWRNNWVSMFGLSYQLFR